MFTRKQETKTELLHRRYDNAMKRLSDFNTDAAFFHHSDSPIDYGEICGLIKELEKRFQANVYDILPSAKI